MVAEVQGVIRFGGVGSGRGGGAQRCVEDEDSAMVACPYAVQALCMRALVRPLQYGFG